MVAGSPSLFTALIKLNVKTGKTTVVRTSHPSTDDIDPGYLSADPKKVSWDTTLGAKAHGYYYPPQVGCFISFYFPPLTSFNRSPKIE